MENRTSRIPGMGSRKNRNPETGRKNRTPGMGSRKNQGREMNPGSHPLGRGSRKHQTPGKDSRKNRIPGKDNRHFLMIREPGMAHSRGRTVRLKPGRNRGMTHQGREENRNLQADRLAARRRQDREHSLQKAQDPPGRAAQLPGMMTPHSRSRRRSRSRPGNPGRRNHPGNRGKTANGP